MYNKSVARRVMKKDPDAFRILYDDWAQRLYSYSYDILESAALSKQVLTETFCRAYAAADTLKDETQLEVWLTDLCTAMCAKAAAQRRALCESEKEQLWAEIARRESICTMEQTMEAQPVVQPVQPAEEAHKPAEHEEWQPIIFLPEEDDVQKSPVKAEESPAEKEEKPRRTRTARKAGAVLAGAMVLVGVALAGGAAVLALAGSGMIQLPASLSGAVAVVAAAL